MLVQRHDRYDEVGEFSPESGRLEPHPRPSGLPPSAASGWFAVLGETLVVFYRHGGGLWLRVGDRVFDLDGDASVDWHLDGEVAVFAAADSEGQVLVRYPCGPDLSDDPTAFVADEDSDLGLFIANVMFDEERSDLVRRGSQ